MPFSPPASTALRSPASTASKGAVVFHSGWAGAFAFTSSSANRNWKYRGCSDHSVPSLSNTATRSFTGTQVAEPAVVAARMKPTMPCFTAPSFQEGSESPCANAADGPEASTNSSQSRSQRRTRFVMRACSPPARGCPRAT